MKYSSFQLIDFQCDNKPIIKQDNMFKCVIMILGLLILNSCANKSKKTNLPNKYLEKKPIINDSIFFKSNDESIDNDSIFLIEENRHLFKYEYFIDSFNFDISPLDEMNGNFDIKEMLNHGKTISVFQREDFTETWETWLYSIQKETQNYFAITVVISSEGKFKDIVLLTYNSKTGELINSMEIAVVGGDIYPYKGSAFFTNDTTVILDWFEVDHLDYNKGKELVYKIKVKEKMRIDYNGFIKRIELIDSTYKTYYID